MTVCTKTAPLSGVIRTTLHVYEFNTKDGAQREAYGALRERLTSQGLSCMESHGEGAHLSELAGPVDLEPAHLFSNQWNTATHRVFDWAQDYRPFGSATLKRGHYLEQTEEMTAARSNVTKCGHCGAYSTTDGPDFCDACVTSEYLKEADLRLTRMVPIVYERATRPPLTSEESARLSIIYRASQAEANTERAKLRRVQTGNYARKRLEESKKKAAADVASAQVTHDATIWLLDHGAELWMIKNFIHYSHSGMCAFGWRTPLSDPEVSALLDVLGAEFPWSYEIKTASGRKLGSA